jgi:MarR family transcriptional regulator for hemolysin
MPIDDSRRDFSARLMPLARAYRRHVDRALASTGQSHATALAVMLLGRLGDGVRQGALAEELGVEAPSVVPLIDAMEREGLVERRVDPGDRRARTLHLSDAGRRLAAEAEIVTARVRADLFTGVPADEVATAARVLRRLADAIAAAQEPTA